MSTDEVSIGPVVLEIALKLLEHSHFFTLRLHSACIALNHENNRKSDQFQFRANCLLKTAPSHSS